MANKSLINKLCAALGIFLGIAPVTLFAAPAIVTDVQVAKSTDYFRVIFSISNPHQCDVFSLFNPGRLVVDLEDGRLETSLKQLDLPKSVIKNVRSGTPQAGVLRIVFDMAARAQVKSSLDSGNGKLFVDIYPESARLTSKSAEAAEKPQRKPVMEQIPVEVVERSQAAAIDHSLESSFKVSEEAPPPSSRKLHVPQLDAPKPHQLVIVIDAGHGGKDSGTVGRRGTQEKNVVLGIALRLAELVNSEPNMRAVMTREGDYFVTLSDRLAISRNDKADLFIAIHADSYFNNQSTGASVYALSPHGASSVAARWLADRENHSELGGVDLNELGDKSYVLRSVLIDLAQTATISDSIKLGSDVLDSLEQVTALHYSQVEQAPFMVLKSPDIPSILVETGFLSNPREEERLREAAYRDKLARALLEGIRHYAASHPVMASNVKPEHPMA
jgi:N-acetylmuramoyl-L-alanine amidase